jgi:hypothetical protein
VKDGQIIGLCLLPPSTPGSGQAAMLHYMTLNVEWSNDHKIMVLPVTF